MPELAAGTACCTHSVPGLQTRAVAYGQACWNGLHHATHRYGTMPGVRPFASKGRHICLCSRAGLLGSSMSVRSHQVVVSVTGWCTFLSFQGGLSIAAHACTVLLDACMGRSLSWQRWASACWVPCPAAAPGRGPLLAAPLSPAAAVPEAHVPPPGWYLAAAANLHCCASASACSCFEAAGGCPRWGLRLDLLLLLLMVPCWSSHLQLVQVRQGRPARRLLPGLQGGLGAGPPPCVPCYPHPYASQIGTLQLGALAACWPAGQVPQAAEVGWRPVPGG
jgi:hypothetical protein